jgi:hypothetical protein
MPMFRSTLLAVVCACATSPSVFGQEAIPNWHMGYIRSHRATFEAEWKYSFPRHKSKRWFIALAYAPDLPWCTDVVAKAELLTSDG